MLQDNVSGCQVVNNKAHIPWIIVKQADIKHCLRIVKPLLLKLGIEPCVFGAEVGDPEVRRDL